MSRHIDRRHPGARGRSPVARTGAQASEGGPTWIERWQEIERSRRPAGSLHVLGCDWVSRFLGTRGVEHERSERAGHPDGGVWFLPATAVATELGAARVAKEFGGRAQVVLCGAPTSAAWLGVPGLVPQTIVAALPRDPVGNPLGWGATCTKLSSGRLFSLRPYLAADAKYHYFRVSTGRERHGVINRVGEVIRDAGISGRRLGSILEALEELLLRALGAASRVLRLDEMDPDCVQLGGHSEIRVCLGLDDETVGVATCDLYSHAVTEPTAIVDALRVVMSDGRIAGSEDLALVKAAKAATHFVVNVASAGVCEVMCLVARGGGRSRAAPRSFGVFLA